MGVIKAKFSIIIFLISFCFFGVSTSYATAPDEPGDIRAISGNQTIYLSWNKSNDLDGVLGYRIYVSQDGGDTFNVLKALPGNPPPNAYTVRDLINGQEYTFAITSYNDELEESNKVVSDTVIPADTSVTDTIPPEDITNLKISPNDSKVYLTWDYSVDTQNDLVGYNIYISEDSGETFKTGKSIGYTDEYFYDGLTNGKSYVFKVTAYDEVPNESIGVISDEVMPEVGNTEEPSEGIVLSNNLPQTDTFYDVKSDNVFKSYIEFLAARKIINGYDDGGFHPNRPLTRGEAVKIIMTATGSDEIEPVSETSFGDVSPQNPLAPYIEEAFFYNIVRGYGQNLFKPDDYVLRKEFAKMFMEATEGTMSTPVSKAVFPDVPLDNVFSKWIYSAYKKGFISGYEDGLFKPDNQITRAEASKIIAQYLQGASAYVVEGSNYELHLLSLINSSRIDRGLSTLTVDTDLSLVARNHATDLSSNVKLPSDVGSDGRSYFERLEEAGIYYAEASENVAKVSLVGRTEFEALEYYHTAIMNQSDNEPNQKSNILSTYKDFDFLGVGVVSDDENSELYIVVDLVSK